MIWNTNAAAELTHVAHTVMIVMTLEFVIALFSCRRPSTGIFDYVRRAWSMLIGVDSVFLVVCCGLGTVCYRNPSLIPDWASGISAAVISAMLGSVLVFVTERMASYFQEKDRMYGFRSIRILIDEYRSLRLLRSFIFRTALLVSILSPVLLPFIGNLADAAFAGTGREPYVRDILERVQSAYTAFFIPVFVEMIFAMNAILVLAWERIDGYEEDWGPYLARERMRRAYEDTMCRWFGQLNGVNASSDVVNELLRADLDAARREGQDVAWLASFLCTNDPYRRIGRRRYILASRRG